MTIGEIYELAIKMGVEVDPRGEDGVKKVLKRLNQEYEERSPAKKKNFDLESLRNPYADSRILFGDRTIAVDKVAVGIDIEPAELLLVDRLNQKGEGIDLAIAHHPEGISLAGLPEVMESQIDLLAGYGVPVNVVEGLMGDKITEIKRRVSPGNHARAVDAARLLGIPFMNIHTPADNLVFHYLEERIAQTRPEYVKDVLEMLEEIPEYNEAAKFKLGPTLFTGAEKNRAGKVVAASLTGGTEGSKNIYERLVAAGVGTVIGMHASEEHVKKAKEHHLNLVIAGHMSSDSVGMNLLLDELEKQGIQIIPFSGFIRISRIKSEK